MDENTISALSSLDPSLTQLPQQTEDVNKNQQVDQNEFIQLLVTQLQNQDPLDPMSNEEFAVQLAQFSQVEELIGINEKLDAANNTDLTSLASYLGHSVVLDSSTVHVANGTAEDVTFTLEQGATQASIDFIDSQGNSRGRVDLGPLEAGKQKISLNELNVPAGEYTAVFTGTGVDGSRVSAEVKVGGVVSGYIPGPEPKLLVGEREVGTGEIIEVRAVA